MTSVLKEDELRWTEAQFFELRDRVFEERKARIMKRREEEIEFYKFRPWEQVH